MRYRKSVFAIFTGIKIWVFEGLEVSGMMIWPSNAV